MWHLLVTAFVAPTQQNDTRRALTHGGVSGGHAPAAQSNPGLMLGNVGGYISGGYESGYRQSPGGSRLRSISALPAQCAASLEFDGQGEGCDFSMTEIGALDLSYSQFQHADFSGADLRGVKFYDSILDGARCIR